MVQVTDFSISRVSAPLPLQEELQPRDLSDQPLTSFWPERLVWGLACYPSWERKLSFLFTIQAAEATVTGKNSAKALRGAKMRGRHSLLTALRPRASSTWTFLWFEHWLNNSPPFIFYAWANLNWVSVPCHQDCHLLHVLKYGQKWGLGEQEGGWTHQTHAGDWKEASWWKWYLNRCNRQQWDPELLCFIVLFPFIKQTS